MTKEATQTLIHIGHIHPFKKESHYLFLREVSPSHYVWFEEQDSSEVETQVSGATPSQAIREAHRAWKHDSFRTVICGFKYTLPERDEHGVNALFSEMVTAHNTPTGVYFDEALGHSCQIQRPSREALDLMNRLKKENRL